MRVPLMVTFSSQLTTLALYKLAVCRAIFCPVLRHQNTDAIACDVTATCNHAHLGTWSIRCDMRLLVHTVMLLVTSYCALRRKYSLCALRAPVLHQQKGWDGRGGWGHLQGDMHMVAARLGCQSAMVGIGWANSCPSCMDRLRSCMSSGGAPTPLTHRCS